MTTRPEPSEYPPFYAGYIALVQDGDIVERMRTQLASAVATLREIDPAVGDHRYAPGKWSVRELLGHVADTEQIMGFRALHFARLDPNPLPGFCENDYVQVADFGRETLPALVDRLAAVRTANIQLFQALGPAELSRSGTANDAGFTVRSLAWILVGHVEHHLAVLRERYGA